MPSTQRLLKLRTASLSKAICDQCAIEHRFNELVLSAMRVRWHQWPELPLWHPAWNTYAELWSRYEVDCLSVPDYDGVQVLTLCKTHLKEIVEEML